MQDRDLAAEAANGDQEAFTVLVKRYRPYVYTIAYKVVLHEDDALEVTQNVFERVANRIGQFNGRGKFRTWLATIAVREALNLKRRPGNREKTLEPETLALLAEGQTVQRVPNPRQILDMKERRERLEAALTGLSEQQRAILVLRLREDLGPLEISQRLNIPARQVRVQTHRAVARLRRILSKEEER